MIALAWVQWWYGPGWRDCLRRVMAWLKGVEAAFSVGILLKTLFSPWKQVITTSKGAPSDRFRAFIDNLISRFVGLGLRLVTLLAAGLMLSFGLIGGLILVAAWPLLPPAAVVLVVRGLL